MGDYPTRSPALAAGQAARAYRQGIAEGRQSMAREIRAAILQLLTPDMPPRQAYQLRLAADIASRQGRFDGTTEGADALATRRHKGDTNDD